MPNEFTGFYRLCKHKHVLRVLLFWGDNSKFEINPISNLSGFSTFLNLIYYSNLVIKILISYTDDTPKFISFLREKVPIILETDVTCKSSLTIKNVKNILYKIIKSYQEDKGDPLSERNLKFFATSTTSKFNFLYNERSGQHMYGDIQFNEAIDNIIRQNINDEIVTLEGLEMLIKEKLSSFLKISKMQN